jgi:hypothetical protein
MTDSIGISMPAEHVPPSVKLKAFNCPHCGAFSDQTWCNIYGSLVPDRVFFANSEALERMKALQVSDKQKDALKRNIYFTELAATRKVFFGDQTTAYQAYQLWNAYISPIYARRREFAERICDHGASWQTTGARMRPA